MSRHAKVGPTASVVLTLLAAGGSVGCGEAPPPPVLSVTSATARYEARPTAGVSTSAAGDVDPEPLRAPDADTASVVRERRSMATRRRTELTLALDRMLEARHELGDPETLPTPICRAERTLEALRVLARSGAEGSPEIESFLDVVDAHCERFAAPRPAQARLVRQRIMMLTRQLQGLAGHDADVERARDALRGAIRALDDATLDLAALPCGAEDLMPFTASTWSVPAVRAAVNDSYHQVVELCEELQFLPRDLRTSYRAVVAAADRTEASLRSALRSEQRNIDALDE